MKLKTQLYVLAILFFAVRGVSAAETAPAITIFDLREDIVKVAKAVTDVVVSQKQQTVKVAQFSSSDAVNNINFGPGLTDLLARALSFQKEVTVSERAELTVTGRYRVLPDPRDPTQIFVKLTVVVTNGMDVTIKEIPFELQSNRDIARIAGKTRHLEFEASLPGGSKEERNRILAKKDGTAVIDGALLKADAKADYGVEIRVKRDGDPADAKPRIPTLKNGEPQIEIAKGEAYEIVLYNPTKFEAAASICIDGLDVFTFSEVRDPATGGPAYTHYIIKPGENATVYGWHLRDTPPNNYASFLVTEYGKGASAIVHQSQQSIGVITVSFSRTVPASRGVDEKLETGLGSRKDVKVEVLQRTIASPHEFVSIRYSH